MTINNNALLDKGEGEGKKIVEKTEGVLKIGLYYYSARDNYKTKFLKKEDAEAYDKSLK